MFRKDSFAQGFNWAAGVGVLALIVYFAWWFFQGVTAVWTPFLAAILLALLLDPIVDRIQRHGTKGRRGPAVVIVFLAFLAIFVGVLVYLIPTALVQMGRLITFFSPVTYKIEQSLDSGKKWDLVQDGVGGSAFVVRGLKNGTEYTFQVTGTDTNNNVVPLPTASATPKFGLPLRFSPDTIASAPVAAPPATPARTNETASPPGVALPNPLTPVSTATPAPVESVPTGAAPAPPPPKGELEAIPQDGRVELTWKPPAAARSEFEKLQTKVDAWLQDHRKMGPFTLPANISTLQRQYSSQFASGLQNLSGRAASLIASSLGKLIDIILVPLILGYLLVDIDRLRARLLFMMPERMRTEVVSAAGDTGEVFGGYIRGMALVSALYGFATGIIFVVLGMLFGRGLGGYALLIGVLSALLYPIPYIGAFANLVTAGVVALVTGHSGIQVGVVIGIVAAVNALFDNFLVPRLLGNAVGLNPLLTMFVLLLGGSLFGLLGMLFAVPLAGSIQAVALRRFPKLSAPTPMLMFRVGKAKKEEGASDDKILPMEERAADDHAPIPSALPATKAAAEPAPVAPSVASPLSGADTKNVS